MNSNSVSTSTVTATSRALPRDEKTARADSLKRHACALAKGACIALLQGMLYALCLALLITFLKSSSGEQVNLFQGDEILTWVAVGAFLASSCYVISLIRKSGFRLPSLVCSSALFMLIWVFVKYFVIVFAPFFVFFAVQQIDQLVCSALPFMPSGLLTNLFISAPFLVLAYSLIIFIVSRFMKPSSTKQ